MKKLLAVLVSFTVVGSVSVVGLAQPSRAGSAIVRLDPALDAIISPNAKLEMLKSEVFGISEGPVWVPDGKSGYVAFSDIAANVIYKWTLDDKMEILLDKSGYTGDVAAVSNAGYFARAGLLYIYNFGSNGITLDQQGRLVFTAQGDRAIVRLEKDGKRTVLADRYEGKRLSRPNDLVIKSDGAVYFSDPHPDNNPTIELPYSAVFMIKNGAVRLLDNTYRPNGLAFSPDEKYLYVNGEQKIRRYDVQPDGTIANGRIWADLSLDKAPGNPDGMKVDVKGNVYCTGPGGVWILSPDGKHLGTILLPEPATNMAFAGVDGKTLYITDRRSLERIRLNTPGPLPGPKRTS